MINKNLDIEKIGQEYQNSTARYVLIEDLFDTELIKECEKEFLNIPDELFFRYADPLFEWEKYALNKVDIMPERLRNLFNFLHSDTFLEFIRTITGLDQLLVDEKRWGGGLHKTKRGGYLSTHKDFNVLPDSYSSDIQLLRSINLIGYLSDEDQHLNKGELEIWEGEKVHKILNRFNSWVIFDTRDTFHGHPYPFEGRKPRMSIASYYYLPQVVDSDKWKSTEYLKLPWMEDSEEYMKRREDRSNPKIRYSGLLPK